jgi:hypothetical protein
MSEVKNTPKTGKLRRRAFLAFEVAIILTLLLIAFWSQLIKHKDHDWITWGIAIFLSFLDAWLFAMAILGFFNISLFKLLKMKRRPVDKLF